MKAKIEMDNTEFDQYTIARALIKNADSYGYILNVVHTYAGYGRQISEKSEYGDFYILKRDEAITGLEIVNQDLKSHIKRLTQELEIEQNKKRNKIVEVEVKYIYKIPWWIWCIIILLIAAVFILFSIKSI